MHMFRMVADKLILDSMAERKDLCVNVSVCHQLAMLIIVLSLKAFLKRKQGKTYLFT